MIPLEELLLRFKNLTNTEKNKKEQIVKILSQKNLIVGVNQISFSQKTIFIKTPPVLKTEILLKKEELLNTFNAAIPKGNYQEIK